MPDTPSERKPPRGLRALSDWLKRAPASEPAAPGRAAGVPARIGHYRVTGKLGEGGMGIVYSARDERLGRTLAIKTMGSLAGDDTARQRFWREARAAASVNHPNICQIFDVGEDGGQLYIAMELLEGEPLAARLARGPLAVDEMMPVALGVLAALTALHGRGIVHRDLKPSNVFLTPHAVKLLDFGLARAAEAEPALSAVAGDLTHPGMLVGTPRYMAPEQVAGDSLDARADLFAAGAIFYEMLAGRPAFAGRSVVEVLHATLHEQPPALSGSPAVAAVDRLIRRALAKRPAERPASAEAMAAELRAAAGIADGQSAIARPLTRIVVLPFRVLRADAETDFLAFSLPDAIATSLKSIGSLLVRSSAAAARFAGDTPDLRGLASEAGVDRVVMGTLLRAGDQVQTHVQLVEAPEGTLLASHTVLASLGDLFRLQEDITSRVVSALSLPLGGEASTPDAPRDAGAYGLFLRANQLARQEQLAEARSMYQRCVDLDPSFAPAWAQLGRCHWITAKFVDPEGGHAERAQLAFRRALEINPRLAAAHKFVAGYEADAGRAIEAMTRLLGEASRHGNDPELFAGLVHAGRYCGLFEESLAAYEEARRLDPNVLTSGPQTMLVAGRFERLLALERPPAGSTDNVIFAVALGFMGRNEEARDALRTLPDASDIPAFGPWMEFLRAWLDRRSQDMLVSRMKLGSLKILDDPEAIFQEGWMFCDAGRHAHGLERMRTAVRRGYFVAPTLEEQRAFDSMRGEPAFQELLAEAEAGRQRAREAFHAAGGERLLGLGRN